LHPACSGDWCVYPADLAAGLFYRPPLEARYQLLSVPALALLLAGSIAALWEWRKVAGVLAGAAILALWLWALPGYYDGRHLRDDFQDNDARSGGLFRARRCVDVCRG
jgi:hypothetical protein